MSFAILSALDNLEYDIAEKLIRTTTDARILNDLDYDNVPLCCVLVYQHVNLYLAKLLVEAGADPNARVSHYIDEDDDDFNDDFDTIVSKSPLEMLLYLIKKAVFLSAQDMAEDAIIGISNQVVGDPAMYKEQLMELLDIFLAHGGNPNGLAKQGNVSLFHLELAKMEPNLEVVMKLSAAGGDLNRKDAHNATALMQLIKHSRADEALTILKEIERRQVNVQVLSVNEHDVENDTALWRAGFAGSPRMVIELLNRGADTSFCRKRINIPTSYIGKMSPLLSPLLHKSYPYKMFFSPSNSRQVEPVWSGSLMNKVISYSISPIVDNFPVSKCFPLDCDGEILKELIDIQVLKNMYTKTNASDLVVLMFGQVSAGLQQLCVRVILEQVEVASYGKNSVLTNQDLVVNKLGLPSSLIPRFNIEALKNLVGGLLFEAHTSVHCQCGCESLSSDNSNSDTGSGMWSEDDEWSDFMEEDDFNYDDSYEDFSNESENSEDEWTDCSDNEISDVEPIEL